MANETILVVDDNPINAKLARIILEEAEFVVHVAGDAEQALHLLQHCEPRLILMDLKLPGVDGLTLTRALREDARFQRTWIVALTAYAVKGDEARASAAGCDGYVTKPIDTDALAATVTSYLARERG
ncbi:MAG: two-component hybrid sensor and regulator [Polyangiaceae bacterium]|jgi:two-component system cell cycle response regulator|nr:two-component hybrid sensor and regulator [Polyangiaceae bacterium]